jgi:pyridoxal phosphate enzyme (YggS family)
MSAEDNYSKVSSTINLLSTNTKLILVSKNQSMSVISSLIKAGHKDFGENRVQEAVSKWSPEILNNYQIKLHLIGKLQSNKVKDAFRIFDYIHTLDNEKLALIFAKLENDSDKKINYFVQVNVGNEPQKSGISIDNVHQFIKYCINDLKLNIIGLMCIPPVEGNPTQYFINLAKIAKINSLKELSMGMSNDYECAIKNGATFVRIGSKIFNSD